VIKLLIQQTQVPLVLDADALNILAENKTWMSFLPAGTILTPHPGEFDRLFGRHTSGYDRYITLKEKAQKHNVIIVLKGAYTCIAHPDGSTWFNSTGNPGMAKGGSGDVLTGVILGLLARGYSPFRQRILTISGNNDWSMDSWKGRGFMSDYVWTRISFGIKYLRKNCGCVLVFRKKALLLIVFFISFFLMFKIDCFFSIFLFGIFG